MTFIKNYNDAITQKQYALNQILASFGKNPTRRNRSILQAYIDEFKFDTDWLPHSYEQMEAFLKQKDIKKYLD